MVLSLKFCLRHSMQKPISFKTLEYLIDIINRDQIQGCFVECGVWKGGTSMWMLSCQCKYGQDRKIYLYDTFCGITRPSDIDEQIHSKKSAKDFYNDFNGKWMVCSLEDVKENMDKVQYKCDNINYVIGDVMKTLQNTDNIPDKIALLRLDTDWHESTKKELEVLFPKVEKNGFIIIDDYYYWSGAKKATDDFFKTRRSEIEFVFQHNSTRLVLRKI